MDNRECCIRMDVSRKRSLYTRGIIFSFMTAFSVLVWLITGMGIFWPIYVAASFILTAFVESLQICSLSCIRRWFNFLTPDWEECEVQRCMNMNINCNLTCNPVYQSTCQNQNQNQNTATFASTSTATAVAAAQNKNQVDIKAEEPANPQPAEAQPVAC